MIRQRSAIVLAGLALAAVPAVAAAAPTAPAVTAPPAVIDATSLQVDWSAATFDPLAAGTRYNVKVSTTAGPADTRDIPVDAPATQTSLTSLQNGATYQVQVVASQLPCLVSDPGPPETCATQAPEEQRESGPASSAVTFSVEIDETAPVADMQINGGAAWTTEPVVETGLVATDASPMRMLLGLGSAPACGNPLTCGSPYSENPTFTLPGADGAKTVFARVVDEAGNETVASDTIGLDTVAPDLWGTTASLQVEVGQTVQFSTVAASDAGSGLVESSFAWSFCKDCAPEASGRTASRSFGTIGDYEVTLSAEDVAGNVGQDTFVLTVTPPDTGDAPPPSGPNPDPADAGQGTPGADPAAASTLATPATTTPGRGGKFRTLGKVKVVGKSRVGVPIRVRVALKRRAKVTFEVLTLPGEGGQTLLKRWKPRSSFHKGPTVYRLSAPTRPAVRVLRVIAGGETRVLNFRIRG